MMRSKEFFSKVAGVSMKNGDGTSRQKIIKEFAGPGAQLMLRRESTNKHDKNAIAVDLVHRSFLFKKTYQIGYLSADLSSELAAKMDAGTPVTCEFSDRTGGDGGKAWGVNVKLLVG